MLAEDAMKFSKTITVPGAPCAKPRMTRRDKWQRRACVLRYRSWADHARALFGLSGKMTLTRPTFLYVTAYFEIPKSRKKLTASDNHTVKPDADNVLKAVCDALFENDQFVISAHVMKQWAGTEGPRTKITLEYQP